MGDNSATDASSDSRHRRSLGPLAAPLIALVLYFLSPTPLGYFLISTFPEQEDAIEDVFEPVYAPVQWLYDNNQFVEAFYDWYAQLFDT